LIRRQSITKILEAPAQEKFDEDVGRFSNKVRAEKIEKGQVGMVKPFVA